MVMNQAEHHWASDISVGGKIILMCVF